MTAARPGGAPHPVDGAPRPIASFIICCDDRIDQLDQAIQSVLAQGRTDVEILVVDAASPNPVAQWLFASYQRPLTRILRMDQPGVHRARHAALAQARGEHVCFLEPDGVLDPAFLHRTLEAMGADGAVAIALCRQAPAGSAVSRGPAGCSPADLIGAHALCPVALIRTDALRAVGGIDPDLPLAGYAILDIVLRIRGAGLRCTVVAAVLHRSGGSTVRRGSDRVDALARVLDRHADAVRADWPRVVNAIVADTGPMAPEGQGTSEGGPGDALLERTVRGILDSRNWRLTRPLRRSLAVLRGIARRHRGRDKPIAVVISAAGDPRTLSTTIDSVWREVGSHAEIIVACVDSSDSLTRQLLDWYREADVRIISDGGTLAAARARALQSAGADIVFAIDAGQTVAPGFLPRALQLLADDATLAFVAGGVVEQRTGFVWRPASASLAHVAGCCRVAFPVVRRDTLIALGGYDGGLAFTAGGDWDLLIRLSCSGKHGVFTDVPAIESGTAPDHVAEVLDKHATVLAPVWTDAVLGHEARRAAIQSLVDDPASAAGATRVAPLDWGDLRRLDPISPFWGFDRGLPVDRYYIHDFLDRRQGDIRGRVLEVKDAGYANEYGSGVTAIDVVDIAASNPSATIVCDLSAPGALPPNRFDCFILTQTIHEIRDVRAVLVNAHAALTPGGVLLTTVPCVSRIDYEAGVPGDWWRFTPALALHEWTEVFGEGQVEVEACGNVLTCVSFLMGIAAQELTEAELRHRDQYFPLILCIRAVKAAPLANPVTAHRGAQRTGAPIGSGPGAVLMYHRVATLAPDTHGLAVPQAEFREQMRHLRASCYPMPLTEFVERAVRADLPPRAVAVTFDDGYLDNLTNASPILLECGMPAHFFIPGLEEHGGREQYWDVVERIFAGGGALPDALDLYDDGTWTRRTRSQEERRAAHHDVGALMHAMAQADRAVVLARLADWCAMDLAPRDSHRRMTSSEIRALAGRSGHTIGAHTVHHLDLTAQPAADQLQEMTRNREYLEALLGGRVATLSYPYGAHVDVHDALVRRAGFRVAVTVASRAVTSAVDPLRVPRLEVRSGARNTFVDAVEALLASS